MSYHVISMLVASGLFASAVVFVEIAKCSPLDPPWADDDC